MQVSKIYLNITFKEQMPKSDRDKSKMPYGHNKSNKNIKKTIQIKGNRT